MKTTMLIKTTSIRADDSLLFVLLVLGLLFTLLALHYFFNHFARIRQSFVNYIRLYYSMLSRDRE